MGDQIERQQTHWEGCWREHLACAVARIEELAADKQILDAIDDETIYLHHDLDTGERWLCNEIDCYSIDELGVRAAFQQAGVAKFLTGSS
jgi:hypothetical protein